MRKFKYEVVINVPNLSAKGKQLSNVNDSLRTLIHQLLLDEADHVVVEALGVRYETVFGHSDDGIEVVVTSMKE